MSDKLDTPYIVVRAASDLPPGFLPRGMEGRWLDRRELPEHWGLHESATAVAAATGRFEFRDYDGAFAEVYEVRP